MNNEEFMKKAKELVKEYAIAHLDKSDKKVEFDVFVDAYKKFKNKCIK